MELMTTELSQLAPSLLLKLFLLLVSLDIITGCVLAYCTNTFTSAKAIQGLFRHCVRVLVFGVTVIIQQLVGPQLSIFAVCTTIQVAFILAYVQSNRANFHALEESA